MKSALLIFATLVSMIPNAKASVAESKASCANFALTAAASSMSKLDHTMVSVGFSLQSTPGYSKQYRNCLASEVIELIEANYNRTQAGLAEAKANGQELDANCEFVISESESEMKVAALLKTSPLAYSTKKLERVLDYEFSVQNRAHAHCSK
jgi:hypothetical protein